MSQNGSRASMTDAAEQLTQDSRKANSQTTESSLQAMRRRR